MASSGRHRFMEQQSNSMRYSAFMFLLVAAASGQVPHQHHPPSSDEYAKVLEDPSRAEWQKPHDVIMALNLKATDSVADIGAGTGYFARRFANHAGNLR